MPKAAATKAPPPPRKKSRWRWLAWLLALLVGITVGVRYLLQPERLGALLLAQISTASGLQVSTGKPARVGVFPDLHIELRELDTRLPGDKQALLAAAGVDLSLPLDLLWDALKGNPVEPRIRHLQLRSPRLDLSRLQRWLGSNEGPPTAFSIPAIDSAFSIDSGQIVGSGWRIDELTANGSPLHEGQTFKLDGQLQLHTDFAKTIPLQFQLGTTPSIDAGSLRLEALNLALSSEDDQARLDGALRLIPGGGIETGFKLQLDTWPQRLPALPLRPENKRVDLQLSFDGDLAGNGHLQLSLQSDVDRISADLRLHQLLDWLADDSHDWLLPPITGTLDASHLLQDDVLLDTVHIDFSEDAAADNPAQ